MDAIQLGKKIQELRKEKGMTQEDLADKTGLNIRTIQRIENGDVDPRSYTLNQIAEALGVEIKDLVRDENNQNKPRETETRKWLTFLHLSGLFILLIPPLVIWILKRDEIPGINEHAKNVMNFQISMLIYLLAGAMSVFFALGLLVLPLLGIYSTIIIIINSVRVMNGDSYKYPLSIKFMK